MFLVTLEKGFHNLHHRLKNRCFYLTHLCTPTIPFIRGSKSTLKILMDLVSLQGRHYDCHYIDRKTEEVYINCPNLLSELVAEKEIEPRGP